ncbi:MAG: site-2 protease family protein [Myxococcaceae bacterium]
MNLTGSSLLQNLLLLIPLLLSLSVHEWAHAYSAHLLGDDTAERAGRLTLNPLVHMDPIGTFLLPLMGIQFGWAKPVPVNPARFRRGVSMGTGMAITAAAGPASNVLLAILCTVIYGLRMRWFPFHTHNPGVTMLLEMAIRLNIALALFNLLPVPPLDGSRLVDAFLPYRLRPGWETFTRYSPIALLVVMLAGGYVLQGPIRVAYGLLNNLLALVVG